MRGMSASVLPLRLAHAPANFSDARKSATEPSTAPTEAVSAGEGQAAGEPDIKPTPFDMVTEIEHCDEVPALTAVTSPGASVGLVALPDEVDPMPAEGPADHLTNAVGER